MKHPINFSLLLFFSLILISCLGKDKARYVDQSLVQSEVQDILANQSLGRRQALLAIRDYEAFLSVYFKTKTDLKAEAMHRLGDLLMEVTHNANQKAYRNYEKRRKRFQEGQIFKEPRLIPFDYSKPIALYERVLKLYPSRPANDRVLYQLAHAYLEEGRKKDGVKTLASLISQYPTSSYYLEAAFRLGDLYFDMGLFEKAIENYQIVMNQSVNPFFQKTLYKMGWSYFKLQRYSSAVSFFGWLLDVKGIGGKNLKNVHLTVKALSDLEWDMVEEVVRVMAVSFDFLGGGDALVGYFNKIGPRGYDLLLYQELGDYYLKGGENQRAIEAYILFLEQNPFHPQAPSMQWSLIQAYEKDKNKLGATKARIKFVEAFGPRSPWAERYEREIQERDHTRLKNTTYQLARFFHSEAQRLRKTGDFLTAVDWYQRFLSSYPESEEVTEVQFLMADGFFKMGRFQEAAEIYETVAYSFPFHHKREEAAYAALISFEKWEKDRPDLKSDIEDHLINSGKRFVETFPDHDQTSEVLVKIADLEFQRGRYKEVQQLSNRLLEIPEEKKEIKLRVYHMLGLVHFQQGEFQESAEQYRRGLRLLSKEGPERSQFQEGLATSLYKRGIQVKEEGKLEDAVQVFLKISEELPDLPIRWAALYEASLILMEQGRPERSKDLLVFLVERSSPTLRTKARGSLARLYENEGRIQNAAEQYAHLWAEVDDQDKKGDFLFYSAVLYEKAQQWKRSGDQFYQFVQLYGEKDHRGLEALFRAAQNFSKHGDGDKAAYLYVSVISSNPYKNRSKEEERYFLAQSNLFLGRIHHEGFSSVHLLLPLEKSLKEKEKALTKALAYYRTASQYQFAEVVTEVSFRIGQLFEEYGESLSHSQRPIELTPDQLREYDLLIEEEAMTWRKKAIKFYERNVYRTQEVGLFDDWVKKSYERLGHLDSRYEGKQELKEMLVREPHHQ